jgi:glucosamine--fructose-6-phosphate aminotransferase (isomerizing)
MCGIVGYVGEQQSAPILVSGLKKLEYRGYDSAGLAVVNGGTLNVVRASGKLKNLEARVVSEPPSGTLGIGHTRWATHGRPTDENAHPHTHDGVAVVHNGIIENHLELKGCSRRAGMSSPARPTPRSSRTSSPRSSVAARTSRRRCARRSVR